MCIFHDLMSPILDEPTFHDAFPKIILEYTVRSVIRISSMVPETINIFEDSIQQRISCPNRHSRSVPINASLKHVARIWMQCPKASQDYNLGQNCWENCILGQHFSKHRSCTGSSLSPFPWKQCCCVFKRKPDPWAFVASNIELGEGVFFMQRRPFGNSFVA